MKSNERKSRRGLWIRAGVAVGLLVIAMILFPGRRLPMAIVIATGIGKSWLQEPIDKLEAKAIAGKPFTDEEKNFLGDFYGTLATGAKLSIIVGQTGRMMDHYLGKSGADFRLEARIFRGNAKVRRRIRTLRAESRACAPGGVHYSPVFYMPDRSNADSVFGLYYGRVILRTNPRKDGSCRRQWRAEVPWQWPSYESLKKKYGRYQAESFPLPNAVCVLLGKKHCLFVDNGLGEYLTRVGLAKTFLAYAEWED